MFPLARVPVWYRFFEPQPYVSMLKDVTMKSKEHFLPNVSCPRDSAPKQLIQIRQKVPLLPRRESRLRRIPHKPASTRILIVA